ncbi:MAG: hypothetical protein AAGA56_22510 [Myxococcota bacterium]
MTEGLVLVALYLGGGTAVALAARRRHPVPALKSALLVALWPLWGPFALLDAASSGSGRGEQLLQACLEAGRKTPYAHLFSEREGERLRAELRGVEQRGRQLSRSLEAHRRLAGEEDSEVLDRLTRLRDEHERALEAMEEALAALHGQLVMARFSDPSTDIDQVVAEVWGRVQGLAAVTGETGSRQTGPTCRQAP